MIDCPSCGASFRGQKCKCGYLVKLPRYDEQAITPCAHQNCAQPAITRDKSGWSICRDHYESAQLQLARDELQRREISGGKDGARYALSKMAYDLANGMKKPIGRDWAYRLRDRLNAGEKLATIQREMMESVLTPAIEKEAA